MDFSEYQALARRTQNQRLMPSETLNHGLYGLSAEVGEVCGLFQKTYQGHALDKTQLEGEIGDVLWFLAELCDANGLKLEEVAIANIEKLKARYPEGFEAVRSLNRE